ncbi:MAG TPA: histidine phosphatase family protein [Sporichthya sp.]|nr:histidine phosphatase family protein [Sporichthya sp.]
MAEVVLVRHGETEWSRTGRHTGSTDVPMTLHGEQQAAALRTALVGEQFALVLASPRTRAQRTAQLAGLVNVENCADLAEWDYGGYEGRTTPEIVRELGRPWTVFTDGVPPGATPGETLEQVGARADRVLDRIRPIVAAGNDVALVGHGHFMRVLGARWLGLPPDGGALLRLDAGSLSRLGTEHDRPVIALWNAPPE